MILILDGIMENNFPDVPMVGCLKLITRGSPEPQIRRLWTEHRAPTLEGSEEPYHPSCSRVVQFADDMLRVIVRNSGGKEIVSQTLCKLITTQ